MAKTIREQLINEYFKNGACPKAEHYQLIFNSALICPDDGVTIPNESSGTPFKIKSLSKQASALELQSFDDGDKLLRFATDRPWHIRQIGDDSISALELRCEIGEKRFNISDYQGGIIAQFHARGYDDKAEGKVYINQVFLAPEGKVGIGTTTPSSTLHIKQTSFIKKTKDASGAVISEEIVFNPFVVDSQTGNKLFLIDKDGNVGIGTTKPTSQLHIVNLTENPSFRVDHISGVTTTPFIIDKDGNVCIGTMNAIDSCRLTIQNEKLGNTAGDRVNWLNLSGRGESNYDRLLIYHNRHTNGNNWNTTEIKIQRQVDSTPFHYISFKGLADSKSYLAIGQSKKTDNPAVYEDSNFLVINNYGKVGIGIDEPSAKLHIVNLTENPSFRVDDASGDTTPFIIDKDGNVGIGIDQPSQALHIVGNLAFSKKNSEHIPKITGDEVKGLYIAAQKNIDNKWPGARIILRSGEHDNGPGHMHFIFGADNKNKEDVADSFMLFECRYQVVEKNDIVQVNQGLLKLSPDLIEIAPKGGKVTIGKNDNLVVEDSGKVRIKEEEWIAAATKPQQSDTWEYNGFFYNNGQYDAADYFKIGYNGDAMFHYYKDSLGVVHFSGRLTISNDNPPEMIEISTVLMYPIFEFSDFEVKVRVESYIVPCIKERTYDKAHLMVLSKDSGKTIVGLVSSFSKGSDIWFSSMSFKVK